MLDWESQNQERIDAECGIDPNNQSGIEQCDKCESENTKLVSQVQTRGADEPMTVTFKCLDCGEVWKNDGH